MMLKPPGSGFCKLTMFQTIKLYSRKASDMATPHNGYYDNTHLLPSHIKVEGPHGLH